MYPFLQLTSTLSLPTYLVVISLTYCLCIYWVYRRAEARLDRQTRPVIALDLCLAIMVGGLIGARALHVFYEGFDHYLAHPLDVLKLWQGGFIYYGGFLGAAAAAWIFIKSKREKFLPWADFFAAPIALGYALGRVGCFLNGCCFGQLCASPWPWAVEFQHPGLPPGLRHPTQLYATFWELGVVVVLLMIERVRRRRQANNPAAVTEASRLTRAGFLFFTWMALHATGRLIMEAFRDDYRGAEIFGFSLSTLISVVLIAVAGLFFARSGVAATQKS